MPALLTAASVVMCPHGGTVMATPGSTKVTIAGSPVLRSSDTFSIIGCPLNVAGAPHPCVQVNWITPDTRSKDASDFTLSESSVGMCIAGDQAPQGSVLINGTQPQVTGL